MKNYIPLLFFLSFPKCYSQNFNSLNTSIDRDRYKKISFLSDRVSIMIPVSLRFTSDKVFSETVSFDTILLNKDKSNYFFVVVHDYSSFNSNVETEVKPFLDAYLSTYYPKSLIMTNEIRKIGDIDVGFLKQKVRRNRKTGVFGAIVFFLPDKRRVELRMVISSSSSQSLDIDRIFNSLVINQK